MAATAHSWVAALTIRVDESEVSKFQRRATGTTENKRTTGRVTVGNRIADVLDVYCRRCGARPGRADACPHNPIEAALR